MIWTTTHKQQAVSVQAPHDSANHGITLRLLAILSWQLSVTTSGS